MTPAPPPPRHLSLVNLVAATPISGGRVPWFAERDASPKGVCQHSGGRPIRAAAVPGRNDPCPCGSGRKYKRCHGG